MNSLLVVSEGEYGQTRLDAPNRLEHFDRYYPVEGALPAVRNTTGQPQLALGRLRGQRTSGSP